MNLSFTISQKSINSLSQKLSGCNWERVMMGLAVLLALAATMYSFRHGYIVAYGDAESHLNIAKRVVDSLTPGFAQLGGIWLPLPHLLLAPFMLSNYLWRTGLAGSIVSGVCFVVSAVYLYRLTLLLTGNKTATVVAVAAFITNPNMLYLQSTPLTEPVLIVFFILSSYYFIKFLQRSNLSWLIAAAFFGFCASLSRYDGWFLVAVEAAVLAIMYVPFPRLWKSFNWKLEFKIVNWKRAEGYLILFCTLAFFGVVLWLLWDKAILGDPLYFTHSQFSAKSQQSQWLGQGELLTYHNLWLSFLYYFVTSMSDIGMLMFFAASAGLLLYLSDYKKMRRWLVVAVLTMPFPFYVITMFIGQSVIFVPQLTPASFGMKLFNVRYGVMMMPAAAVFIGYLFYRLKSAGKALLVLALTLQIVLFGVGYSQVETLNDGIVGSSRTNQQDAQAWMAKNYDHGLVLMDDYARAMSIIRSGIPMKNMIYIGNKPYWEDSLKEPENHVTWIVMQKNDAIWNSAFINPGTKSQLSKYFVVAYASPDILIFKRNSKISAIR